MLKDVQDFLESGPPWLGESHFEKRAEVKSAGARWNANAKKWSANNKRTLSSLIDGGYWVPCGRSDAFAQEVVRFLRAQERSLADSEMNKRAKASQQAQETRNVAESASKKTGVLPTQAEVAECERLGFTKEVIAFSDALVELGPRGTLSREGLILRYCSFMDYEDDEKPVNELSREERRSSWNCEQRFPLPEKKSREFADKLKKRAAIASMTQSTSLAPAM